MSGSLQRTEREALREAELSQELATDDLQARGERKREGNGRRVDALFDLLEEE